MANSDADLIRRTLDGDASAFGFLVDKYKGAVHALTYRKIGNFHTAEDITQDTFLKAYQKLHTLKDWRHFPGWLYRIASRLCLMWYRQHRLPTQSLDTVEKRYMDTLAWAKHTDQRTRQAVRDALETLPESQRTVLTLHYFGGMTCEEIARFIGTSRGAVLDRLYRARLQLKKEMIPMMENTLGVFQLPPTFTQQIMNRIDRITPTTAPQSKPIVPWIAVTATLIVALFIGLGQQSMTRFQQPYSLDAPEPANRVELIDAQMIHLQETKPALINRAGHFYPGDGKKGARSDGTSFSAVANADAGSERHDAEWTQTNGPYGGSINSLFRASDGSLYATTDMHVFRSRNDGDSWIRVYNGLDVYPNGSMPLFPSTITEANGVLYLSTITGFCYSNNQGESWQPVDYHYRDADLAITGFSVIDARIYIGRVKDGVAYSDDYGDSWTPIRDGLPTEPPDRLMTVGTTLFAKAGDDLFRLKAGETSWTKIVNIPELRFLIAEAGTLIIGSETDLHRSTNEGETWMLITPALDNQSLGTITFNKATLPWEPMTPELRKNQSPKIEKVAAFGDTICVLLNDSRQIPEDIKLLRSTDNGRSWNLTEASELSNYDIISPDYMVALSEREVCIGNSAGVFRWTDGESSWNRINEGLIGSMVQSLVFFKNALYASTHNRNGIFKSVDGGNQWVPIHRGLPTADVGALAISGGTLYLGVNEMNFMDTQDPSTAGIYRLAADRNSWIPVQTEMRTAYTDSDWHKGYHQMYSVDTLAISGDTFYTIAQMGNGSRLFRWRRGERYWTDISPHPEDWIYMGSNELTGLAVVGKTIYIVVNLDLMRSRNRGDTWSKIDIPASPSSRYTPQVRGAVVLEKTVFISTPESGVLRSADHGKTWESGNEGLPQAYSWELHAVGNALYVTEWEEGIFRLKDGRDSWEFVKPFLSDYPDVVGALTVARGTLYAGIGASGVYRITLDD